jgi:putative ABC transport system ATP-binding protein
MNDVSPVSTAGDYLVRAENVSRIYSDGHVAALVDVSLAIRSGQYTAIVGPSGSGKSTLLNLLGALDTPTRGRVLFEEQPLSAFADLDRLRARKIGFVFQSFHLLPTLTAVENVQIPMFEGLPLSAGQRASKAGQLLAAVGLAHRASHLPKQMSVGERQRTAIARALANDPMLLLADEPTGNVDSQVGWELLDLFDRLRRDRAMTLVVITHSAEIARRAQQIITLRDGRIVSNEQVTDAMHRH